MTIIKKNWVYILFAFSASVFLITRFKKTEAENRQEFKLKIIKVDSGFGYEISRNDQSFIKQTVIPAIEGTKVFVNEAEAEKTGKLVIYKIEHNVMPSVSVHELDSMKITK